MRPTQLLPAAVLTALLACPVRPVFADGGARVSPYRRPAQLQQPIAPTAAAHLEAARSALQTALGAMKNFDSPDATLNYGGHFARARMDTDNALTALTEAGAFVAAHPADNGLASGPVPAGEPGAPSLPGLPQTIADSPEAQAVDALHVALAALVNPPSNGNGGPVLGDLGGHRPKLIAAVAQIGSDLSNGLAYYKNVRGGGTGIIPLSAPANLSPDWKFGPTARTYLEKVKTLLDSLSQSLTANYPNRADSDPTQGGYVPKAQGDLRQAAEHLTAALTYLDTHHEAGVLMPGPAGPEPSKVRRDSRGLPAATANNRGVVALWPVRKQGNNPVRRLNEDTVRELNTILGWLLNNPSADYHGPVLGDLGGYRGKIMDDLGQTLADTRAAFDYVLGQGPAADAIPKPVTSP